MSAIRRALALALVCAGLLPARAAAGPEAWLTVTKGMVRVARSGTEDWLKVALPHALYAGDRVMTHAGGQAIVQFDDGHEVHLARKTTLQISALEDLPDTGARRIVIRLFKGAILAVARNLLPEDDFRLESSHAIAAVKGTTLSFRPRRVTVHNPRDGRPHSVNYSSPRGGPPVRVMPGTTSTINRGGRPTPPRPTPTRETARIARQFPLRPVAPPRTSTRVAALTPAPAPAPRPAPAPASRGSIFSRTPPPPRRPAPPAPPRSYQNAADRSSPRRGPSPLPPAPSGAPACP